MRTAVPDLKQVEVISTVVLPIAIQAEIGRDFTLRVLSLRELGATEFLSQIASPAAIICAPGDRMDASLIESLPECTVLLASYSVGLDHVDLAAAKRRGIEVSNTPDVLTDATADTAILLMLAAIRGARQAQQVLYSGKWQSWQPAEVYGSDTSAKRLGIVGGGRIGGAMAKRAQAFGMSLSYWSRSQSAELEALGAQREIDFHEFLGQVDVVSLHVPSTDKTRGLIDASAVKAMRDGAILVNTARGDIVNEEAVFAGLDSAKLAAAGIDVFCNEPDIDPRWLEFDSVFLLPHIGSATVETRVAMGQAVVSALRATIL